MANHERSEVAVTVAGKPYTLKFSLNAICEVEAALDEDFFVVAHRASQGRTRIRDLRALLWGGLRVTRAHLTVEAVGDLLGAHLQQDGDLVALGKEIVKAVNLAFADEAPAEGNAAAPAPTTSRRAGTRSSGARSKRGSTRAVSGS